MPRDIKKLKELERIIARKDLELAKYKQLLSSIQALITINEVKLPEENYADLLAGEEIRQAKERTDKKKTIYYEDKPKPEPKLKKCINCQQEGEWDGRSFCPKCEVKEAISKNKPDYLDDYEPEEQPAPKTHVDEIKELQKQGKLKPSEMVKQKRRGRSEALNELSEQATKPTATEQQKLSLEERIAKLPPEAQAQYRANEARAKAAEREEKKPMIGEEGDREYKRLQEKEAKERGEIPTEGNCPHCGDKLEAPIVRGHHQECWESPRRVK